MNTFKKRIDELGRIVIPKEIRNSIKINKSDELELFVDNDTIVIKKTVGIELYKDKIDNLLNLLKNLLNFNIFIFSNDKLISSNYENLNNIVNFELDFNNLISNNNSMNYINISDNKIEGYMFTDSLIVDSNLLGNIIFICKEKFNNIDTLKKIKHIILDLIN